VVNPQGFVTYAWVTEDPSRLPDFEEVRKAIAAEPATKA
jgi:hypothetical protein